MSEMSPEEQKAMTTEDILAKIKSTVRVQRATIIFQRMVSRPWQAQEARGLQQAYQKPGELLQDFGVYMARAAFAMADQFEQVVEEQK